MSYEYMLGIGADDENVFELGVKVAPIQPRKQAQTSNRKQPQRQRPAREGIQQQEAASCGGIQCPDGLSRKINVVTNDPVRLSEFEENMSGQGCSFLCTVGNSHTYCCPSAIEAQEVITDPFATDPIILESVETSIEAMPTAPSEAVISAEGNESSQLGLVAILSMLGLGMAGVIGFLVLRKKRKQKR